MISKFLPAGRLGREDIRSRDFGQPKKGRRKKEEGRRKEERLRPERPFDGAQGRPERVEGRGAESPSEQ